MKSLIEFIKEQVNEGLKGPWITVNDIKSEELSLDDCKENTKYAYDDIDSFLNNKYIRPLKNEDDIETIFRQNVIEEWKVIRYKHKDTPFGGGEVFGAQIDDEAFEVLYDEALKQGSLDDIAGWSWLTGNGLESISFGAESRGTWDIVTFASDEVLEKMWKELMSDSQTVSIYQYLPAAEKKSLFDLWKEEYTKIK